MVLGPVFIILSRASQKSGTALAIKQGSKRVRSGRHPPTAITNETWMGGVFYGSERIN